MGNYRLSIRLPEEFQEKLQARAKQERESLNALILKACEAYLDTAVISDSSIDSTPRLDQLEARLKVLEDRLDRIPLDGGDSTPPKNNT